MSWRLYHSQLSDENILLRVEQVVVDEAICAHLRFVLVRDSSGKWVPGFGRIDLCREGDIEEGPRYEYRNARTIASRLPGREFLTQLREVLMNESSFRCDGVSIGPFPKARWDGKEYWSHNQYSDWPCFHAELDMRNHAVDAVQGPLATAHGAPYFSDAFELIFKTSKFKTFHFGQDSRRHNLHLFIWDYRGQISEVVPDENALRISLDGHLTGLQVKGRVLGDEREKQIHAAAQRQIVETLDEVPRKVELALIAQDDEIIDLVRWDVDTPLLESNPGNSSIEALVDDCLRSGESARVEYKPFVRLEADNSKGDDKKEEVVRTALAMGNAGGGCILLGVDDHGIPNFRQEDWSILKGRSRKELQSDSSPPQERGPALENAVKKYGLRLRDLIQKRASKSLPIQLHTISRETTPILLLIVDQGAEKPYLDTKDNSVWYRANATNRRPSEAELEKIFAERAQ